MLPHFPPFDAQTQNPSKGGKKLRKYTTDLKHLLYSEEHDPTPESVGTELVA